MNRNSRRILRAIGSAFVVCAVTTGCLTSAGVGPNAGRPLATVPSVDLERFAGLWYVIESIGTRAEADAHDAIEIYRLRGDGQIDIEFRFHEGSFDGPSRTLPQLGWVHDPTNPAEWRVQPFWPLRLAYLIIDLAPDYSHTVIGHPSKRWVWIMAREPTLDRATLDAIHDRLAEAGYDVQKIRPVPQRPLDSRDDAFP